MRENLPRSAAMKMAMMLFFIVLAQVAWSQQTVSGTVTGDDGLALPGVNVIVEGTSNGTTTDVDGKFTVSVPDNDAVLMFSFIGFKSHKVVVGTQTTLEVVLQADLQTLEEVVVVGYGSVQKRDVTGSIASVSAKSIDERKPTNVFDALQGQAPGLQITSTSARPGAGSTVRIRGTGTIQGGANPLYVIDGALSESPDGLNPNDIASIEILKDAASTAIYGVQGANGVIIITTKRGVDGKPRFDVNYLRTFSKMANKMPHATADERRLFDFIRSDNPSTSVNADSLNPSINADNDMLDLITRTAVRDQVDLSVSGGAKGLNYYTSMGYLGEEGIVINSWAKTIRSRINIDYNSGRFSIGSRLQFSYTKENRINESRTLIQAIQRPPTFRVYFPDGTLATILGGRRNPLAEALLARNNYDTYDGSLYNFLSFKITDYLKITTDFQFKLGHDHRNWFEPKVLNSGGFNSGGDRTDTDFYWISQTYLNFEKKFGNDHTVTAVAGFSADKTKNTFQQIQGTNYVSEKITTTNAIQSISLTDTGTGEERATTASFFGRVGYNFKGRYLFNANVRRDGSSRFGTNNRWGMFPGVSAGWRFTDESFMQWASSVLDDGKFRVSYGKTGNNRIPFYAATQTYVFGENYYNGVSGIAPSGTFGNKDLGWETTTQFNAGLDLALWSNRVNVVIDYYDKTTDDLLYEAPLPAETGFDNVNVNFGSIQNRGVEIGISGYVVDKGAFTWHSAFNITFNNDKVKTLSGGVPITTDNRWYLEEGGRLGNFYGWKYLGVYAYDESNAYTDDWQLLTLVTDSEGSIVRDGNGDPTYLLNNEPYSGNVNQLRSGSDIFKGGDVIFANHNRDGVIDDQDRVILGNAQPDYYLGINNTFTYKNFMLSFNFYVNWGNKVYDKARRDTYVMSPTNITPQPYFINNAWTHQGQVTDIWIARNYPRNLREINSYFIEDASFIRLRNVKLGYQVPANIASKLHLKGLNAYVYGSNLVTWTNYKWFDPEVSVDNPLEMGLDSGAYPRKREIGFGINVSL